MAWPISASRTCCRPRSPQALLRPPGRQSARNHACMWISTTSLVIAGAFALIQDDREQTEPAARAGMHAVLLAYPGNETGPNSLSHRCADWPAVCALLFQIVGVH
jgi:hypothetical protein